MDNNRLYKTIAEVLGVPSDSINDDSSPETIPTWDSLNHLNIVMALEFEYGISMEVEDVLEMHNVGLIRKTLRKYGVDV